MKKTFCFILVSLILCTFLNQISTHAAGDVPKAVLDLRQSVVRVLCQTDAGAYSGSGFAIGTEEPIRYVVTNLHVVSPNPNGVTILRENNREIAAKVYLQLENADLCVLLLDEALYGVPPVTIQRGKSADAGQAVYALGFPGAADIISDKATGSPEDVTITDGIVSAVKSFTYIENGSPISLLQINAAINPGNSGGPLVDETGRVLGVNSLGVSGSQSINGAVSILELTGALRERGIVYISEGAKSGIPAMVVIIGVAAVGVIIAVLLVIVMLRRAKKKNSRRQKAPASPETSLPEYLKQWGGKLPYDMAAHVLAPVLRELAALHTSGRVHGDISPESIAVNSTTNQASLRAPQADTGGMRIVLRPGFSAPEQYRADGRIGPWSDVYSICAVFYYAVTGGAPLGVMERMAAGENAEIGFGAANIDEAHASALLAGLALDAAARPHSTAELAESLEITVGTPQPEIEPPVMPTNTKQSVVAKIPKKKMKPGKRILVAGLSTLIVLCAGAGGYYLYNEYRYNQAIECIQKQDYKGGVDNLKQVLQIFKSSEKWMCYACAGRALQQNDFASARDGFRSVGVFNGADGMLKEVDYLEAHYLLAEGNYKKAKTIFNNLHNYKESSRMLLETDYQQAIFLLSKKDYGIARQLFGSLNSYKDSKTMVLETDYQNGITYIEREEYAGATTIFKSLSQSKYKDSESLYFESIYLNGLLYYNKRDVKAAFSSLIEIDGYKDSSKYLDALAEEIYNQAIAYYRAGSYDSCKSYLSTIGTYKKSSAYLTLIEGHQKEAYYMYVDFSGAKSLYNRIKALGNFEDALTLRESNTFIYFRLEGNWRGSGYYFKLLKTKGGWYTYYNIPWINWKYFNIKDCVLLSGSDEKGWKKQYSFFFISENSMEVYCHKNKRVYTLKR